MMDLKILRPDIEFELPIKKNKEGYYSITPNTNFIGSKNELRKLAAKKIKKGFVYLIKIHDTNIYKIGVSTKPKRRLSDIASTIPFDLEILAINEINDPYNFEQSLINEFKSNLIKNEWFNFTINEAKYIMVLLHNQQVKESILSYG